MRKSLDKLMLWLLFLVLAKHSFSFNGSLFGKSEKMVFSFKGKIYFLKEGTNKLPDFSKLESAGTIFTDELNIKPRDFSKGFPGITDRFEWFAIRYKGKFYIPKGEKYKFYLLSDDGAKLIIDGKCIINNDGIHPPKKSEGSIFLKKGFHSIEVQYFQGPRYQVALVLSYDKNGKETIFNLKDFNPFQINETECKINLKIGDKILFDFNKYNLKKKAKFVLDQLVNELKIIKYEKIIIEGHTDSIGSEEYNLKLSKKRADSIAKYLIFRGISKNKIQTIGYGEKRPIFSNKTEEGRAKNRRVEIKILKECNKKTSSVTLKEIGENPIQYKEKIVELTGFAKGWAAKNIPEKVRKLFLKLPFAKKNTGLARNWGSFTDGTAVILFPISPVSFGKYKIKAKVKLTNNGDWYLEVLSKEEIKDVTQ